jgi:hypothetical protein
MISVIPSWNSQGVLPPVDPSDSVSRYRSPYTVSLDDFVLRFSTSLERLNILNGLLSFRSALHGSGLIRGFQWLNGSFLENIELLESRHPRDIDVVTFYYTPADQTQETLLKGHPQLFNHDDNKSNYHVDAYFIDLNGGIPEYLIFNSAYWYSIWSHRRNALWKGYLQIDLSQTDDHIAKDNLSRIMNRGDTP